MDWKVGEIKQINGEWYKCIESCDCTKCDLRNCTPDIHCTTLNRDDGKEVIFKKVSELNLTKIKSLKLNCYVLFISIFNFVTYIVRLFFNKK